MYTEAVDEVGAAPPPPCHNKGKRTKRYRPHSPINPFTVVTPPAGEHDTTPATTPAFSDESTTTEEEDTARCLILLARGGHFRNPDSKRKRHAETAAAPDKGGGGGLYACKTCNRVFHSFQALGGHRASHKKPKNEKKSVVFSDEEDFPSPLLSAKKRMSPSSLQLATISAATAGGGGKPPFPSPRMHECSYCGAEFTSGQALGGHMRRHRAGPISPLSYQSAASIEEPEPEPKPEEQKKPRNNGLSLDLNLPAPEDENQRFGKLVLSNTNTNTTPTLVDCHY